MDIAGSRVNSKRLIRAREDAPAFDAAFYEGLITGLFIPWLAVEIPEGKWQKLQEKLKIIISKIFLTGTERK